MEPMLSILHCYLPDKRTLLNTEIYIPGRYWDKKLCRISKELPAAFGNAKTLNEKLGYLKHNVEEIIYQAKKRNIDDPINFLNETFHPNFDIASFKV